MDILILLWLQNIRYALSWIENFFVLLTSYSLGIGVVISVILYWGIDKQEGCFILMNAVTGNMCNNCLKNIFQIQRPWVRDERIVPNPKAKTGATGYSFPSGHSEVSGSIFGTMGMEYKRYRWICFLLVLSIGFSRMFLGVHTPQDVCCGILESFGIYLVLKKANRYLEDKDRGDKIFLMTLGLPALVFLMVILEINGQMNLPLLKNDEMMQGTGLFLGFFSGMIIERKYINLKNAGHYRALFCRLFCGILVTGCIYLCTGWLEAEGFCFVRYYLIALTVMALVPFIFVRLFKSENRISSDSHSE